VDFFSKTVEIGKSKIKVQIWDTAGQERYKAFSSAYYNGANGAIITYDVTNRESFDNVKNWIQELKNHLSLDDTVVMLIGNKTDLDELRQVQTNEGGDFAKRNNFFFMETSALMNNSAEVPKAFMTVIEGTQRLSRNPHEEPRQRGRGQRVAHRSLEAASEAEVRRRQEERESL